MNKHWLYIPAAIMVVAMGIILLVPIQPTGLIHSMPDEQGAFSFASGIYIGDGIVLTNWHVLKSNSWRQEYFRLPLWNEHIYNFETPVDWVIFSERNIDLAIGKLSSSRLDWLNVDHACLSAESLITGQMLNVTSGPLGLYPPITAHLTVTDPAPLPRMDLDPQVREDKRHEVISFAAVVQPGEEDRIDTGSSGGAVTNEAGELVGLLWARYDLPDGTEEILVTPVSGWLPLLKNAEIAAKYKEYILEQVCK